MCSISVSEARKPKNSIKSTLADARVFSHDLEEGNGQVCDDAQIVVTRGQLQAREGHKSGGTKKSSKVVSTKRDFAEALYRQANFLHHRGDYESALYLYHRAARLYPRELRQGGVSRRTAAAISSAANPLKASRKVLPGVQNLAQVAANFSPETAALRAKKIIEESLDPVSSIKHILDYFDSQKNFWQDSSAIQDRSSITALMKSKAMLKQSSVLESNTLKDLQAAFASGDFNKSLEIGVNLLAVSEALPNRYHYQVAARHYLAMIQIALGRHDRAVDEASRMVRLARGSGDVALRSRSMMTLGKVHLSFGHLDAAARAWERLVLDVKEAIPKAWLLHEIGRCYFEMKRYSKALETAARCIEYAEEGNSRKWLMHGKLLNGQTLIELGRYGEAVASLTVAAKFAADEENAETSEYLSNLIHRVSTALRIALYSPEEFGPACNAELETKLDDTTGRKNSIKDDIDNSAKENTYHCPKKSTTSVTRSARTKNRARSKSQREGKNTVKGGKSRLSSSVPRGSGITDLSMTKKDDNRLAIGTSGIKRVPDRSPRVVDPSSLRADIYETGDDMLTYRTRIIRKEIQPDRSSTEKLESLDGRKIVSDGDETSDPDDQQSLFTGKTYVVDGSRKCSEDNCT